MTNAPLFPSAFVAGYECSTQRRRDDVRVDALAGTRHDVAARDDYAQAVAHGMRGARDGLRWHLIEQAPGVYDWSSWTPMLKAAQATGMTVAWDIWHYGTPEDLRIWGPEFVDRLCAFAHAAALHWREHSDAVPRWCPVNEMSFYSFIAGDAGEFWPHAIGRGFELKAQMARAAIAVADVLRDVDPRARLLWAEPLVNVHPRTYEVDDRAIAMGAHVAQYQAFDMICGRLLPELGGRPELLDVIGVNFYPHNQWMLGAAPVSFGTHAFVPLREMLAEVAARYGRPLIVAETGAEGSARAPWLHYVCQEVAAAIEGGHPFEAICLYPVTSYPGWDDDRICETGLFGIVDDVGTRAVYAPLHAEMRRWQPLLEGARARD